jgi:hypothetical protein
MSKSDAEKVLGGALQNGFALSQWNLVLVDGETFPICAMDLNADNFRAYGDDAVRVLLLYDADRVIQKAVYSRKPRAVKGLLGLSAKDAKAARDAVKPKK